MTVEPSFSITGYVDAEHIGDRFEVAGEDNGPSGSTAPQSFSLPPTPRFSFARPSTSASTQRLQTPRKCFTKSIYIGRVEGGTIHMDGGTMIVEFSEHEANVPAITDKVKNDLKTEEDIVLCDMQGNRILEGSGTAGLVFWRQNSRKIVALNKDMFEELHRKKRRRNSCLHAGDTAEKVEELVLAAEELPAISQTLRELAEYAAANKTSTVALTAAQASAVQDTFKCVVCRDVMARPVVAPCCRSLIGCNTCISEWVITSPNCPKCRDSSFREARFCLTGLGDIIDILHPVIRG